MVLDNVGNFKKYGLDRNLEVIEGIPMKRFMMSQSIFTILWPLFELNCIDQHSLTMWAILPNIQAMGVVFAIYIKARNFPKLWAKPFLIIIISGVIHSDCNNVLNCVSNKLLHYQLSRNVNLYNAVQFIWSQIIQ